jgi:C4-dicarboxylate-specific signal transduction histidine kinase
MQHPPVQLSSLADELRVIIGQDWEEIGGKLEWHVPASFPPVQAERDGLLQVLLNLSQNALRAAEVTDEPRLMIQALDRNGRAVLRITNNGPAIADPSSLFQPFRTASTNGTGLGLYVARAMVKSFGGELNHLPTAVGATFELTLRFAASGSIEHDEATEVEA